MPQWFSSGLRRRLRHKQIVWALPQDCPRGIAVAVKEKSAFNFAWRSEAERWNFSKSYFKYALRISWEFFRHRRKGMETGLPGDGKGKLRIFVPRKSFQFTWSAHQMFLRHCFSQVQDVISIKNFWTCEWTCIYFCKLYSLDGTCQYFLLCTALENMQQLWALIIRCSRNLVTKVSYTCDPMDCSPLGSSVQGILQASMLEWIAISFSRGSSQPRNQTQISCIAGRSCVRAWLLSKGCIITGTKKKNKILSPSINI